MPRLFLDSTGDPRTLIPAAEAALGRHVDGWIVAVGGAYPTSAAAIQWVRASGRAIAAYWEDLTPEEAAGSYQRGHLCAQAAIAAAQAVGLPSSVRLYVGIEAGWSPSAEFLTGWADGQTAGPYHGSGGVYGNPYSVAMQNALAAARAANGNAAQMPLWSAEPEPGGAPAVPEWGPATCAGATVSMWQWQEGWQSGAGPVDLDLVADGADGIWEGLQVGQFSDVPAAAWYAPAVAEAVSAGLMDGTAPGVFAPEATVTRAQLAVVCARVAPRLTAAPASGDRAIHPTAVMPSRPRHSLANPAAWLASSTTTSAQRQALLAQIPVRDQQQTGMCVAEVAAAIRQWWDLYLGVANAPGEYSVVYTYGRGHQLAGATTEGMQPVWAWESLRTYGVCPRAMDTISSPTEDVAQAIASLTPAMGDAAATHRITAYGPVALGGDGTVGENAAALASAIDHAPIALSIPCSPGGMIFSPVPDGLGGYVAQWQPGTAATEGHELFGVDYRTRTPYTGAQPQFEVLCRNSWGSGYGADGNVWLGATYPLTEAWSITCTPLSPACLALAQKVADLQEFLAQYPSIPADQIAALQAAISAAQAQQAVLGCKS